MCGVWAFAIFGGVSPCRVIELRHKLISSQNTSLGRAALAPYIHTQKSRHLPSSPFSAQPRCCLLAVLSQYLSSYCFYILLQSRSCHPNLQNLNISHSPLFESKLSFKMHGPSSESPTSPTFSRSTGLMHGWYVAYLSMPHDIALLSNSPDRVFLPAEHSRTPYPWQ